jgi:hypothetical protein
MGFANVLPRVIPTFVAILQIQQLVLILWQEV